MRGVGEHFQESCHNLFAQAFPVRFREQFVTGAGYRQQVSLRWNQAQCRLHLCDRTESVPGAVHEQRRSVERLKVFRAQLCRLLGRMEWIREQEKTIHQFRFRRSQHGSLSSTVRMTTQDDVAVMRLSHRSHCCA